MTAEEFRAALETAIRQIINAVGGEGTCQQIGYRPEVVCGFVAEHRFWALVDTDRRGAIVGRSGTNAHRLCELVRTRATVLGRHDRIVVRVVSSEREAPAGVFPA